MVNILIDTCVWLDIAKDPRQRHLLDVLQQSIHDGQISLIVPRIVMEELNKNRQRIIEQSKQSITSMISVVKDHVEKLGNSKNKKTVLNELSLVKQKTPTLSDSVAYSIITIEELFKNAKIIETSEEVLLNAAKRALKHKAPFHREKNSINDAIIFEIYASCISGSNAKGNRFAFVTHNFKDFSDPNGNHKVPHPDFSNLFSKRKSLYYINLGELLRKLNPILLADLMFSREILDETRTLDEIQEMENELFERIWYQRHKAFEFSINNGKHRIISDKDYNGYSTETTKQSIWNGALKNAMRIEKKYKMELLGPFDDFEWGMINGKLSAIRWVLGDQWDNLDT